MRSEGVREWRVRTTDCIPNAEGVAPPNAGRTECHLSFCENSRAERNSPAQVTVHICLLSYASIDGAKDAPVRRKIKLL